MILHFVAKLENKSKQHINYKKDEDLCLVNKKIHELQLT